MTKTEKEVRTEREGAEHSITHPLEGTEAIASGSTLSARLGLVNGREAYLGILLHTLAEFAREPVLGGHRSAGANVSGEFEVFHWAPGELEAKRIGVVSFDELGFRMEGEALQSAFNAVASPEVLNTWNLHTHLVDDARSVKEAQ